MTESSRFSHNPRRKQRIFIFSLFLIVILMITGVYAQHNIPTKGPIHDKSDPMAIELMKNIRDINENIKKFEVLEASVYRQNGEFLKSILPPMKIGYIQADGIINYTAKDPYKMRFYIYRESKREFYYKFETKDGYTLKLNKTYLKLLKEIKQNGIGASPLVMETSDAFPLDDSTLQPDPMESPEVKETPVAESTPQPSPSPSPAPSLPKEKFDEFVMPGFEHLFAVAKEDEDGSLVFYKANPLNLIFPFSFKRQESDDRIYYKGEGLSRNKKCHIVDYVSSRYGTSRLYIDKGEQHFIRQIDRIDPKTGMVYATAYYSNFKVFHTGGWIYRNVEIVANNIPILTGSNSNINIRQVIVVDETSAPIPSPTPTRDPDVILREKIIWTMSIVLTVIILITVLTFFLYRYWFFKMRRKAFGREVIVMEGDRPGEKVADLFDDLDIPNTQFTSEKLTEERSRLEKGSKKKPRVLVIAPGMFTKFKSFNFLVRAYVKDGGRAIIFEHGVENVKDMVFTSKFVPFDRNDPNMDFIINKKWEKIWKNTSINELQKRTKAFYPYELIADIEEKDISINPIIAVVNSKTKIKSAAICLLKEGNGEYMIVQYRLLEAMRKLKFTASTAENMLKDLMNYMFGEEVKMEFAPKWIQKILGLVPPE